MFCATDNFEARKHRAHLCTQRWGALHEKKPKLKSLNTLLNLGSDILASLSLWVAHHRFPLHCLGFREPQINFSISSCYCPKIGKVTLPQVKENLASPQLKMLLCQILTKTVNGIAKYLMRMSKTQTYQWRTTCLFSYLRKDTQPNFSEVLDTAWYYWCASPKYSRCPLMMPWDVISLIATPPQLQLLSGIGSTTQQGCKVRNL